MGHVLRVSGAQEIDGIFVLHNDFSGMCVEVNGGRAWWGILLLVERVGREPLEDEDKQRRSLYAHKEDRCPHRILEWFCNLCFLS